MKGKISEIFYSMQGEVPGIGEPAIFIRFSGCNLRCEWCDTKYAFDEGTEMTAEDVATKVSYLGNKHQCNNIIITGGEPTFQSDFLFELVAMIRGNTTISIETNGTKQINVSFKSSLKRVIVSPKITAFKYKEVIDAFQLFNNTIFKIVHTTNKEVLGMVNFYELKKHNLVIMPLGSSREKLNKNIMKTWEFCMKHGFRMGYRLHIQVHDTKRGV